MPSYKKGILYLILFFVVTWMFILGIFVGRGSAPVKFDTREFQKRLANIAGVYEAEHKDSDEIDIQFYEDLQKPMSTARDIPDKQDAITPNVVNNLGTENQEVKAELTKEVPIKLSQKSMTKAKYAAEFVKSGSVPRKTLKEDSAAKKVAVKDKTYQYTIQIAAFRDIQSALDKISSLKAKGHTAYKTLGEVQDEIWHRVRVGRFTNTEVARKYLRKLKQDNINGIIIKQDS
ncbi:MAG: SPOR domain-containing protein [Desulfobacteraceae bacterium]|nr:SPOR domain-containing protein [Desulfobacteraceae bacterium]